MSSRFFHGLLLLSWCVWILGCNGDLTGQWISQLQSPDVETRRAAARNFSQQSKPNGRAIAALTQAVADSDAQVRRMSINSLGKCGTAAQTSLPSLIEALHDPEPSVRLSAALAIQKIDPTNPAFAPVLIEALRAGDGRILLEAGALGQAAAWAVPTLIELLSHPTPQVRALAAQTLGRIGTAAHAAKSALERATHDSNITVQAAAQSALQQIQHPPVSAAK